MKRYGNRKDNLIDVQITTQFFLRKFSNEKKGTFTKNKKKKFQDFNAHLDLLISFRLICDKLPILTVIIRFRRKWQMGISYLEMYDGFWRNFFVQIIVHLLAILLRNYHMQYLRTPYNTKYGPICQLVLLYFIVQGPICYQYVRNNP